uniref:Dolichyl-diphosphooligosaccharide--protein glycosyltransferase subunit DAD1 n=1 Tax=Chenopodium quinoa TaxID=63459 RepID=A0A803MWG3_CHEQI
MARSTSKDAQALFHTLRSAYAATPTNLKIIDLYVVFAISTALIQVAYMAVVGSFPFNSFLSGVLSCVGTAVLAVCLRIQVNKENKEFKWSELGFIGLIRVEVVARVVFEEEEMGRIGLVSMREVVMRWGVIGEGEVVVLPLLVLPLHSLSDLNSSLTMVVAALMEEDGGGKSKEEDGGGKT